MVEFAQRLLSRTVGGRDLDLCTLSIIEAGCFAGRMCTAGQSDVGLLIETAFAIHLADGSSSSSEVVLGIWKTAQQLKSEADKAGRANKVKVVGFACSPTCFRQN